MLHMITSAQSDDDAISMENVVDDLGTVAVIAIALGMISSAIVILCVMKFYRQDTNTDSVQIL
jgi:hypothetical protein